MPFSGGGSVGGTALLIAEGTVGADAASVYVSASIPTGYRLLHLVIQMAGSTATADAEGLIQFNDDTTTSHYITNIIRGDNPPIQFISTDKAGVYGLPVGNNTGFWHLGNFWISQDATLEKQIIGINYQKDQTQSFNTIIGGKWNGTAEIAKIALAIHGGTSVKAGSKFFLEGYK